MQGRKGNESRLFYMVTLSQLVPLDHPIRRISEVLDLRFLYADTRQYYSCVGKPWVDPVVLFKLYLIGYFFNIPSERRLFREDLLKRCRYRRLHRFRVQLYLTASAVNLKRLLKATRMTIGIVATAASAHVQPFVQGADLWLRSILLALRTQASY
jgi:hypothetical protein